MYVWAVDRFVSLTVFDLSCQSIGISAAPKFQPPISKKPAVGSSRGPIAPSPEPAHRVSKVLPYSYHVTLPLTLQFNDLVCTVCKGFVER